MNEAAASGNNGRPFIVHRIMTRRVLLAALVFAFAAVGVLAPSTAKPVGACSIALERDHPSALAAAAKASEIVIVGEVIDEQAAELPTQLEGTTYKPFRSITRVVATLKGSPEREITLSPLGFLAPDCTGGPRLPAGEQVLLFLEQYGRELYVYGYKQGKYVLTEGEARTEYFPPSPIEPFLRRVAAITDAPGDQLDAALTFARGEPSPEPQPDSEPLPTGEEEDSGPPALLIGLISAGAAAGAVALGGAAWQARRRRGQR